MCHTKELAQLYVEEQQIIAELIGNAPMSVSDAGFDLLDWAVEQPKALAIAARIKQLEVTK